MTLYALWPQRSSFPPLRRCLYFSNITHVLSYRIIFLQYNMGFYQK